MRYRTMRRIARLGARYDGPAVAEGDSLKT